LEKTPPPLRMEFIVAYESDEYNFTELCDLFGISRECGPGIAAGSMSARRFEKSTSAAKKSRTESGTFGSVHCCSGASLNVS